MGNEASTVLAVAGAKSKVDSAMKGLNESLGLDKKDGDNDKKKSQLVGVASKKEQQERQKQREQEYLDKQAAREARKTSLQQQWNTHRQANQDSASDTKKNSSVGGFFSTK